MRIPFPERISIWYAVAFAFVLGIVEAMQGSAVYFVLGVAAFILLSTIAFNVAGGFTRPSGAFIFLNATLTLIIGVTYKAWLGERAESNLLAPQMTILVYDIGMVLMLLAAYVSRRFSSRRGLLQNSVPLNRMKSAAYGCVGLGLAIYFVDQIISSAGAISLMTAVAQVDHFIPMGIMLGVAYQIRKSGGRSTLSLPAMIGICWLLVVGGFFGFSKEGFLIPLFAWLLTAASLGYRFSLRQSAALLLGTWFFFQYMVPYAQYGRNFRDVDTTNQMRLDRSIDLLSHLGETRQQFLNSETQELDDPRIHYYDHPAGFWDRLQMLSIDDALINFTDTQHPFGYLPIVFSVENWVPHFIWKDKPTYPFGNIYAHEIGLLAPDDHTTGVSFSPISEAWHMDRWTSLLLAYPVILIAFFVVFDSLGGDVRRSPWGLMAIIIFAHTSTEGALNGMIYLLFFGVVALLLAAYGSSKVMPLFGQLFIPPERRRVRSQPAVRSIPRRSNAL